MKDSEYFRLIENYGESFDDKSDRLIYKVTDMIPEVSREEVFKVKEPKLSFLGLKIIPHYSPLTDIIASRKAVLTFGHSFLSLFDEKREQEAAVLHELKGHYLFHKKNIQTKQDLDKTNEMMNQIHGKKPRTFPLEELEKRYIGEEIFADNAVVEAGYGSDLYSVLIKLDNLNRPSKFGKKSRRARIKNLEKILGLK